jgi:hypothetical protein
MTKHLKFDRHGNPVEDDDGILPDGGTRLVRMMLRDGSTVDLEPWQADVIHAHRLGLDDGLALHKPGPRYCTDQVGLDAKAKAYADGVREMCDARKQPPPTPPAESRANVTSIGRGADAVPRGPVYDAVKGQRVKDAAYRAMVDELTTAWQRKL